MAKKEFKKNLMHSTRKKLVDYVFRDEQYSPQIGYEGVKQHRKVGDVWEDEYYRYEQMEGYVMKTGKNHEVFKEIRDFIRQKEECQNPECTKHQASRVDKIYISQTGYCLDCLTAIEADIKIAGLWDDYEKWRMYTKAIGIGKDAIAQIQQGIKDLKPYYEFIQESGKIERWELPKPMDVMKKEMEDEIDNISKGLSELEESIVIHEQKLKESTNPNVHKIFRVNESK
jgi:hypothetical protein